MWPGMPQELVRSMDGSSCGKDVGFMLLKKHFYAPQSQKDTFGAEELAMRERRLKTWRAVGRSAGESARQLAIMSFTSWGHSSGTLLTGWHLDLTTAQRLFEQGSGWQSTEHYWSPTRL